MLRKIKFIPDSDYVFKNIPPPIPAKEFIPEWYRKGEFAVSRETGLKVKPTAVDAQGGLKACVPFIDAMISGYIICTWEDIEVTKNDGATFEYKTIKKNKYTGLYEEYNPEIVMIRERHGDMGHTIPRPYGASENHLILNGQWGIKLPRGWSLMVTHPFNRFDLPFISMAGFMDSDEFWTNGNLPFFMQKDWTGIIPKGTPIFQIIPVKRNSWISSVDFKLIDRMRDLGRSVSMSKIGFYKKNIWVRKEYN